MFKDMLIIITKCDLVFTTPIMLSNHFFKLQIIVIYLYNFKFVSFFRFIIVLDYYILNILIVCMLFLIIFTIFFSFSLFLLKYFNFVYIFLYLKKIILIIWIHF